MAIEMKIYLLILISVFSPFCLSQECVEPTGGLVELAGVAKQETFPGRPNYESIEDGDEPETGWILTIDEGICVSGFKALQSKFQIFWLEDKGFNIAVGKIKVKGKTMEAHTGHHHTPILVEVESVSKP